MQVHTLSAAAALLIASIAAQATPVNVSTPFFNLEYRGANSVGWTPGSLVRFGANTVSPVVTDSNPIDWSAGTVAWASQSVPTDGSDAAHTCQSAGGTVVCRRIYSSPSPLNMFMAAGYYADSSLYRGTWYLNFQNGSDYKSQSVFLDPAATQAPKVANITLSGTSQKPTFGWSPPDGAVVNGYRVNIYDKSLMTASNSGQVYSENFQPNVTSFTVDPAKFTGNKANGYVFQDGVDYMIEISLIQTKNTSSSSLANSNIQAIARMYADFRSTQTGGPVVNLPVVQADGSFLFNMTVKPGVTYYIDPEVAVGYDYATGVGDPWFLTVDLPDDIGDGLYDIYGYDAAGQLVLLAHDWNGANVYSFGPDGVDRFRVLGIETSAGLNPGSTTAFVTGLTFTGAGQFTGTQTPITVNVDPNQVPEPVGLAFAALGLVAVLRRRRMAS